LGTALAPGEFASPNLANQVGKSAISKEVLTDLLGQHADPHLDLLIQILTNFELCYEIKETGCYNFPCFITEPLEDGVWDPDPRFVYYHGRQVQCGEELDCLPPGLFNRLQVRAGNLYTEILLFKNAMVVNDKNVQCLIKTDEMNDQITFVARTTENDNHALHQSKIHTNAHNLFLLLEILHHQLYKLLKVACPNISMKWHTLSPMDLKAHKKEPYVYKSEEIVNAIHSNVPLVNKNTGEVEELLDVLYAGCRQVEEQKSGERMPIAFLPDTVFEGLEELLGDMNEPKVGL